MHPSFPAYIQQGEEIQKAIASLEGEEDNKEEDESRDENWKMKSPGCQIKEITETLQSFESIFKDWTWT